MSKNTEAIRSIELVAPLNLGVNAAQDIGKGPKILLADVFALFLKTKNCHWHVSGPHFRDYHLLLNEQATQIFARTICQLSYRPLAHLPAVSCGLVGWSGLWLMANPDLGCTA